jgi:signal transduction histidine kinase
MQTIRGRLAVWYAIALVATLAVFAFAIYAFERPTAYRQLDANMQARADLIAVMLSAQDTLLQIDPLTGRPELVAEMAEQLRGVPDYGLLLGADGVPVFDWGITLTEPDTSPGGGVVAQQAGPFVVSQFADAVSLLPPGGGVGSVQLRSPFGQVRYYSRPVTTPREQITAVVSGISTGRLSMRPARLVVVMLLVAPFVVLASTGIAYVLAARTLEPVDNIVDEVEAITDGRSLHRRLATPTARDEVSRLTFTLNAMLSRLERNFMALRRFTADASHELKTPLTVLRSGIERAITHPEASPEVLEVLEETLVGVKRMTDLVDSLLTLARADEGRAPLHLERVDLRDILAEIAETANILGEQWSVNVSVAIPEDVQQVSVDRNRFRQLLMNLLTNAVKYTPAGGDVSIESSREHGNMVLRVRDTGIGIAPGELPYVFDRFWRADPARSRSGQRSGSGLGLAIGKWIAEAHGGSIQAQSRPGRGTTMTVTLPFEPDA